MLICVYIAYLPTLDSKLHKGKELYPIQSSAQNTG